MRPSNAATPKAPATRRATTAPAEMPRQVALPATAAPPPAQVLGTKRLAAAAAALAQLARPTDVKDAPLRLWVNTGAGFAPAAAANIRTKPATLGATFQPVTAAQIDAAWAGAQKVRREQLLALLDDPSRVAAAPPPVAEDGSVKIAAMHMGFTTWGDGAGAAFVAQMAEVGRIEGFRVVVRCDGDEAGSLRDELKRKAEENSTIVEIPGWNDIWAEDGGSVHRGGAVSVPAPIAQGLDVAVAILTDRVRRLCPRVKPAATAEKLVAQLKQHAPWANHSNLGAVAERDAWRSYVGLAVARGAPVRAKFCPDEGGNMIVARGNDGALRPIVGKDTFALARANLTQELVAAGIDKNRITDDFVLTALAKDLGVDKAAIVLVEQPASYHVDVKALPVANGVVLLNDAHAVVKRLEQWLVEEKAAAHTEFEPAAAADRCTMLDEAMARLKKEAPMQAAGEAACANDLEKAGLRVVRLPLVYPQGVTLPISFVNAEQGLADDGSRFLMCLGADKRAEAAFLADLQGALPEVNIARIYGLDPALTVGSLTAGGGVNCRATPEPE